MRTMPRKSTRSSWAATIVGAVLLLGSVPAMATTTPAPPSDPAAPDSAAVHDSIGFSSSLPDGTVTLPTGDRVEVRDGRPRIIPGPGRRSLTFTTQQYGDRLEVVPSDVAPRIAAGAVDDRRFDVAWLLRHGYDDARTARLPKRSAPDPAAAADHVLTIRLIDGAGLPVSGRDVDLFHLEGSQRYDAVSGADGTVEVPLPAGSYVVEVHLPNGEPGNQGGAYLVDPGLTLDQDTALTLDARTAEPMSVQVPRPDAKEVGAVLGFVRLNPGGDNLRHTIYSPAGIAELSTAPVGEPVADELFTTFARTFWARPDATGQPVNSPYTYDLLDTRTGRFWHGLDRVVQERDLAQLPSRYHASAAGRQAEIAVRPYQYPATFGYPYRYDLPATVTHFVEPGAMSVRFEEYVGDPSTGDLVAITELDDQVLEAGRSYPQRWNAAVAGPLFDERTQVARTGDRISVTELPMYGDGDGRTTVALIDSGFMRLYRDGTLVGESANPCCLGVSGLAPEDGRFRLVAGADRSRLGGMSTRVDVAWTFRSAAAADRQVLPLWLARFHPPVDENNTVPRQPVSGLEIELVSLPGAAVGSPETVELEVSGDDGQTWTEAVVHRAGERTFIAEVPLAADTEYVSLRSTAVDSDGNRVEQTVIRAYAVR